MLKILEILRMRPLGSKRFWESIWGREGDWCLRGGTNMKWGCRRLIGMSGRSLVRNDRRVGFWKERYCDDNSLE